MKNSNDFYETYIDSKNSKKKNWEKIKAKKHVFEVRKCTLAPKILKNFTEMYFFPIVNHEFFQIFLRKRGSAENISQFFPCSPLYLNRKK